MSSTATVRVMSPEEITTLGSSDVPHLRLPERATLFAERQMRLRQLSRQHTMGDFLSFMADVCQAQQSALQAMPSVPIPTVDELSKATLRGQAALSALDWPRDPAWQGALRAIVAAVLPKLGAEAQAALQPLTTADGASLDEQADAVLAGAPRNLAQAPIIGAALQVYWTHLVTSVQARHADMQPDSLFGRIDDASRCPCCGSLPVASITRTSGGAMAQRYLHCALCGAEWHLQRTQCPHCLARGKLAYQSLDLAGAEPATEGESSRAAKAPLQAEECETCNHYLKILHTDRDPFLDPVADDLASITLDLLMSEAGKQRHGQNLALVFHDDDGGDAAAGAPPPRERGSA